MTQLATFYDIFRQLKVYGGDRVRGDYGVEIETETEKKYEYPNLKYWGATKDNSLRDWGVEYVLRSPMSIPELEKALVEFDICEKKYKFKKGSISTSVHVHVNMLNETPLTLANFLTTYALMENLLIRYSGPDRLSNLFCLPICDAEGVNTNLVNILSSINRNQYTKLRISVDKCKYGALNPATLTTLGTVEIRSFRGETDTKVIQKWLEIIDKMKQFARQSKLTPPDILKLWKDNRSTLVNIIFQEYAAELRYRDPLTKKDITDDLIRQNLKYAADLACVSKDWTKFGVYRIKPVYKEKIKGALEELSNTYFKVPWDSLPYHERLVVIEKYHLLNPNVRVVDADGDI